MNLVQKRNAFGAVLIVVLTIVAYIPALRGGFIWDDDAYVTQNDTLTAPDGLVRMWTKLDATPQYYPLVFTTFWIERHLWGLNPFGYHLVNVLLHAAGAILLWRILLRLQIPGAGLAALLFALHPVHVESVAWITERKNVLSGVFYFAALACYLRFANLPNEKPPDRPAWKWYAPALLLFCAALLSKTVTASLPAAILLLLWWKRDRLTWREVPPLIPFFIFGLAMGLTTAWLERHHVGAAKVHWGLTPLDRVLIAGRALWFYVGKLFWPHPLIFTYPRWRIDSGEAWQYLFPLAAILVVFGLWSMRKRLGKGPLVAALFFGGTLFPALGFFDVYPMLFSYVADHFQYLASLGPLVLAAALGTLLLRNKPMPTRAIAAICLLIPLAAMTWRQGRIYSDIETLWRETLKRNDNAWMAHNNLGVVLYKSDRVDDSAYHFERAIELNPNSPAGYNGLVDARVKQDRWDEVPDLLAKAMIPDPTYGFTHYHLGQLAEHDGRPDEAIAHYQRALELMPQMVQAHNDLAILFETRGDVDRALSEYEQAINGFLRAGDDPKLALVYYNVAALFESAGQTDEAIEQYRRAVESNPDYADAQMKLANLLFARRDIAGAATHYHHAVRLLPANAQVHYNYGVALSNLRRMEEAAGHFIEALRIQPDYLEARFGLARVLELTGQSEKATDEYEKILRDHPDHAATHDRVAAMRGGPPTTGSQPSPSDATND